MMGQLMKDYPWGREAHLVWRLMGELVMGDPASSPALWALCAHMLCVCARMLCMCARMLCVCAHAVCVCTRCVCVCAHAVCVRACPAPTHTQFKIFKRVYRCCLSRRAHCLKSLNFRFKSLSDSRLGHCAPGRLRATGATLVPPGPPSCHPGRPRAVQPRRRAGIPPRPAGRLAYFQDVAGLRPCAAGGWGLCLMSVSPPGRHASFAHPPPSAHLPPRGRAGA